MCLSFNIYSVFGYACFMCICLKRTICFFGGTRSVFFGEDKLATLLGVTGLQLTSVEHFFMHTVMIMMLCAVFLVI